MDLRRQNLRGFVYCPFRARDILHGIGDDSRYALVDYALYDGTTLESQHHLHKTQNGAAGSTGTPSWLKPSSFKVAERTWTLIAMPRAELALA